MSLKTTLSIYALKLKQTYDAHTRTILAAAATFGLAVLASTVALWAMVASLPTGDQLRTVGDMSQATTLYDVADRPVFTIFKEYRVELPLSRVSPTLRRAILAIEDQRFFDHGGIDYLRIGAAAIVNMRQGRAAQGGSTITQQLARQTFLTSDKTLRRKIKEVLLAIRLERMYTKDEILELYLNKVYFGDGLYGVEAAARGYFGKSASDLTLPESALLAGLVKAPSAFAPTINLQGAIARRNVVLQALLDQGAIVRADWEEATRSTPVLRDTLRRQEPIGQYFKEEVRQQLVEQFGWARVSEGGLRVYTTIDPAMQRAAEAQVAESLRRIDELRASRVRRRAGDPPIGDSDRLEAALIALDATTGEVRAMVGGRDFTASPFNRAVQALRQPGSAFKPFVYAAALEAGYTPATIIDRLNEPIDTLEGAWAPEDEHSTAEAMSMRTALRTSSNRAAVRMLEDVGADRAVEGARRLGMGVVPSVPSLALGSGEVTLLALTSAYGAFANGGSVVRPTLIRRIEDRDGTVLFESKPTPQRVFSEATAYLMSSMMSDVVNAGTGARARSEGFRLPAAGKTGTTNDFVDAWFVGFTPRLVTGVWLGFDQRRTILPNGFAGDLAVPLWARFMKEATAKDKAVWFKPPSTILALDVCRLSGERSSTSCTDGVYTEYFARGTEPTTVCAYHSHPPLATRPQFAAHPEPESATLAAAGLSAIELPRLPPTAVASSESPSKIQEAPTKKRGFWSRVFGRRDNGNRDDERAPSSRD